MSAFDIVPGRFLCHLKVMIDRYYPLADTSDAYRYVEAGQKSGNIIITVKS